MGRHKRKPPGPEDMNPYRRLTISTLKSAVEYGRTEQIRNSLTRYGLPKNGTVMTDYSILQMAIKRKKSEIAKLLINAGCQLNGNGYDDTPLVMAIKNEDEELTALLLRKGAKVNTGSGTILHLAAKQRSLKMLNFIFNHMKISIDHVCNGRTPFQMFLENCHNISEDKNVAIVRVFLAKGASINFKTSDGQTVLHHIVKIKQNDIIKQVLQMTSDVNAQDNKKNTILHNLMNENNITDENIVSIVTWFLLKGAKVDIQDNSGNTVCHLAAKRKYLKVLQIFLQCQWDVNCCNNDRKTVLHFLCDGKVEFTETDDLQIAEIAEICIKKGAAVDSKDNHSKTPLYWAVLMRQKHMVKNLLHYGANPNFSDDQGGTILENLMKQEVQVVEKAVSNPTYYYARTYYNSSYDRTVKRQIPQNIERDSEIAEMLLFKKAIAEKVSAGQVSIFHYCAANLHLKMLRHIISYSKNPNIRDSHQNTIIHTLLTHNLNKNEDVERKVVEIVAILLSKAADVNAANENGETPLHLAAKSKHFQTSKALLQQKASVRDVDNNGNTVLHFLCMLQFETNDSVEQNLTELFVSKGCDINARNKEGMTPLLFAAQSGSINMTRILLSFNAKIDCMEKRTLSMPIHLAAVNNHSQIIQLLAQHGADVNVRRGDHKTALHLSVNHEVPEATKALLENGADTDLRDGEGKTPLHWACWYESLDNTNELLEYGADVNVENNSYATPLMLTQKSTNIWTKLRFHVAKLEASNMPVSRRNRNYIEEYVKEYRNYAYASEVRELERTAIEEILKMEKVPIASRTSLADVLWMSADKLSHFQNNENFQKLLNSDDFKEKFPIYADLLRACYRKGIIRSDLMISAKDAFRSILGLALPDTCCDAIFYYLDNENLHNLDKAAKIKIAKRKGSLKQTTPQKRAAQQRESEE